MRTWCRAFPALLLVGVFTSCFLVGPARAAVVSPEVVESGSVIVTAETAEVRDGPSLGSAVITVVGKGEIFLKEGRTGGWYYVKINDDAFGWISGRAISRYPAEGSAESGEATPPLVGPYEGRNYPYYPYDPGGYYGYPYYYWGQPSLSWEWYYYGRDTHRDRSWDHGRDNYRDDRDRDRPRDDSWRRDDNRSRGDNRGRSTPQSRPHVPRPPFLRR